MRNSWWPRDRGGGEEGQSLIEFALALPLLLVALMGIFDLGLAFYQYNTISNVAREGARYAIAREHLPMSDSDFTAAASNPRSNAAAVAAAKTTGVGLDPNRLEVHILSETDWTQRNSWGYTVTATVTYSYTPITPLVPGPIQLRSRAVMITE